MKTRKWTYAATRMLVVALMALAAPLSSVADAVTNAYWTGSGHGYASGPTGVGVVGNKGMVSAFYTGSRDGYDSRLLARAKRIGSVFLVH